MAKNKFSKAFREEQEIFSEFCKKEYIYELENGEIVRLIPSEKELAHLLALHKYKSFDIIDAWVNAVDRATVNAETIFNKLDDNNLTKKDFEESVEYTKHGERILHFTRENLNEIIYNVKVFRFNFDPAISDNDKAEWTLLREFREIKRFFQLLLFKRGNPKTNEYGLLSIYIDNKKNPCIEESGKKIDKLTVYDTSFRPKKMIFEKDYVAINELRNSIQEKISKYHSKNETMYRSEVHVKHILVEEINEIVLSIFSDIDKLFEETNGDLGLTNKGRTFLKLARNRHPDLINGFKFII